MKNKDINKNPDFEQNHYSRTAKNIYKNGFDSFRIMKWLAYYDRSYYENINYFNLLTSILTCPKEISEW